MGDIAEDLDAKGGALSTAKDLFAGALGGVAQVLTGEMNLIIFRLLPRPSYHDPILKFPSFSPLIAIVSPHLSLHPISLSTDRDERVPPRLQIAKTGKHCLSHSVLLRCHSLTHSSHNYYFPYAASYAIPQETPVILLLIN